MSSNPFAASDDLGQLVAFVADEETRDAVTESVANDFPSAVIHDGGYNAALSTLSAEQPPSLVVVDISDTGDARHAIQSLLAVCGANTRLVALGRVNDIPLYREIIKLGASEYLVKPVVPSDLAEALRGALRPPAAADPTAIGLPPLTRIVGVIGARSGVGASTIAVNTAWILAHERKKTVAALDFDLQFGTMALSLDLEPSHGFREVMEHPERIDGLFVASALSHESENFYVLSAEEPLSEDLYINSGAFGLLVDALPGEFDLIVADIPARVAAGQRGLLQNLDTVLLVSDLSLAGMRDAVRIRQLILDNAPAARVYLILNNVGAAKKGELPRAEFERSTEMTVRISVPSDLRTALTAANSGKPIVRVGAKSPLAKSLREIADVLLEGSEPESKKSRKGKKDKKKSR